MTTAPPPGFYDDGSGQQRWWDGATWTEHRQGAAPVAASAGAKQDKKVSGTAVVGYILAVAMPFIGFFVGLALIARSDRHGIGVLLTSVLMFFIYVAAVTS